MTAHNRLTDEQEQIIISNYTSNISAQTIANNLNISKSVVYHVLKRNGLEPKRVMHHLTEEQVTVIVSRYKLRESAQLLADEFKINITTIYNTLKRLGVSVQKQHHSLPYELAAIEAARSGLKVSEIAEKFTVSESTVARALREAREEGEEVTLPKGRPVVYKINHNAFDVLTPEALYWIGFIFADGHIAKDDYGSDRLIIGLAEKDILHLDKFRTFLDSTHPIHWYDYDTGFSGSGPCVYFSPRTQRICDKLTTLGIVIKRTRIPVSELVESRDFWRGAVDGDGWLGTSIIDKHFYPHISLSGQKLLLELWLYFLTKNNLGNPSITPTKSGIFKTQAIGGFAAKTIEFLYKDATTYLDRKNVRAQAIISGDLKRFPKYSEIPAAVRIAIEKIKLPMHE